MGSIIGLLKNWFNRFFGNTSPTPTVVIPEVTPVISVAKTPGLSCPVCSHRIIISIESLLSGQEIQCPACGLELSVDNEKSEAALASLNKLQSGLNQASKIKSENRI